MFHVVNFAFLLRGVAVTTTFISIIVYSTIELYAPDLARTVRLFTLAPTVALLLTLIITSKWTSRLIWRLIRYFNSDLYPDLNGSWEGEITTEGGQTIAARAIIRQALLDTQIDMHTETAKSVTLEATPASEGGQYKLYYSYRAKPKRPGHGSYTGSTIFDVRRVQENDSETLELSGYYYTERKTLGRTRLRQQRHETVDDVSFY